MVILHGAEKKPAEINAAKLVEFMGGEAAFMPLPERGGDLAPLLETIPRGSAIIVHAAALATAMPRTTPSVDWLTALSQVSNHFFLYGFSTDTACNWLLQQLTGGGFATVERLQPRT